MESIDYSIVLGIDKKHLEQLRLTFPTWLKHKPMLLEHWLAIFYDDSVDVHDILAVVKKHPNVSINIWPPVGVEYPVGTTRWNDRQRYKMLAGFVHIPPHACTTPYWLKLDTDTVATGMDDWVDPKWFEGDPAIVASGWGYTKPPMQMLDLDEWFSDEGLDEWYNTAPLDLVPEINSDLVRHKRIISWCGFFNRNFTKWCSDTANECCGVGMLPVPSQDGYMWYMAKRRGLSIRREHMKSRGWAHCGSMRSIKNSVEESLNG